MGGDGKEADGQVCRACEQKLAVEDGGRSCPHCGYINLFPDEPVRYPAASLGLTAEEMASADAGTVLRIAGDHLIASARDMIGTNLPAANALLLFAISDRDSMTKSAWRSKSREGENESVMFNWATQLLYLLVCELGEVSLQTSEEPTFSSLNLTLWPILGDAIRIERMRSAAAAGLSLLSIDGGALVETRTEVALLMAETQLNDKRTQRLSHSNRDPLLEPELNEAIRAVLGFSLDDVNNLFRNHSRLLGKLTKLRILGDAVKVATIDGAGGRARPILEALTLTLERVREFETPSYFGFGERRKDVPPPGLPREAIALNWTAYYPCYRAVDEDGTHVALYSNTAIAGALAYMLSSRSLVMRQLIQRVRDGADETALQVKRLAKQLSARLEQQVAARLQEHGFKARSGVVELGGVTLPHEIDAVGVRVRRGVTEIVVVEAKDLDFPLQKAGQLNLAIDTIRSGARQLDVRIEWIRSNWRKLVAALGMKPTESAALVPLLVTRRYLPAGAAPGFAVVPYNMLAPVLRRLIEGKTGPYEGLSALPRIVLSPEPAPPG